MRRARRRPLHVRNPLSIPWTYLQQTVTLRAPLPPFFTFVQGLAALIFIGDWHMPCGLRSNNRRAIRASIVAARMRQTSVTLRPAISRPFEKENAMTVGTILLIVLILLLIGALPSWPYSSGWGYRPTGLVGVVLIVVIILLLMGRI
ncbi:hypothetical protein QF002_006139 [Paraburkholderia youngii]